MGRGGFIAEMFVICAVLNVCGNFPLTVPTSAAMATPSSDSTVSNGVYVPTGIANGDVKPVISTTPLADFLMQLEDYTPTVSPHNFSVCSLVICGIL